MEILKTLIRAVPARKLKTLRLPHAPLPGESSSKLYDLYSGISTGRFDDDGSAAQSLYGTTKPGNKFSKPKYDLRAQLLRLLPFVMLEKPKLPKPYPAIYQCYAEWTAIKLLYTLGTTQAAVKLLKKLLRKAEQYEPYEIVIGGYRLLRAYHGNTTGSQSSLKDIEQKLIQSLSLQAADMAAESAYYHLISHYVQDKSTKVFIAQQAAEALEKLKPQVPGSPSNNFFFKYKMIELIHHMSLYHYKEAISICEEADCFFRGKPFFYPQHLVIFQYQWIVSSIQLGQFDQARQIVRASLNILRKGSFNWYKAKKLEAQVALYEKDYLRAYQITVQVARRKQKPEGHPVLHEEWILIEAYMKLLAMAGLIQLPQGQPRLRPFRLQRFMNEFTIFSQDKRGMNIPVLAAQILFLISKSDFGQAIDRFGAIEKYAFRHLKAEELTRSRVFFRTLSQLADAGFAVEKAKELRQEFLLNLSAQPQAPKNYHIEIIPYEDLWPLLSILLEQARKAKRNTANL